MRQNEATPFLPDGTDDPNIYGSAWLFARWLLDQYSSSEADLMKPLVRDATMHGVANVTDKTGRSWDELDGYYTMMLAADDYPGFTPAAGARFEEPSWNLRGIYAGLSADTRGAYVPWHLGRAGIPLRCVRSAGANTRQRLRGVVRCFRLPGRAAVIGYPLGWRRATAARPYPSHSHSASSVIW